MITAEEIRRKYPNPVKANLRTCNPEGQYCVGGAIVRCVPWVFVTASKNFPVDRDLAEVLGIANPDLCADGLSRSYAERITCENDLGNFDHAWAAADEALQYKRRQP